MGKMYSDFHFLFISIPNTIALKCRANNAIVCVPKLSEFHVGGEAGIQIVSSKVDQKEVFVTNLTEKKKNLVSSSQISGVWLMISARAKDGFPLVLGIMKRGCIHSFLNSQ